MPRNGSGTYDLPITFVAGTPATAADQNTQDQDIGNALTQSLCTDGQSIMSGQLKGYAGTVSAPGYCWSGGLSTGFYLAGTGQIGVATLGATAMLFNNDQSVTFSSTANLNLPNGTTAQRPGTPTAGMFRFNSTNARPEFYDGSAWQSFAASFPAPQGYLTPVSGTPIITSDSIAATVIYYTPYIGDQLPIPTSGAFSLYSFAETAITLTASQAANNIYDVYAFIDSGVVTFGFSPSWSAGTSGSVTAGSCARGTGTGGTALTRLNGFYTNAAAMTLNNGATTYNIAAQSGIYLGSIFVDGTQGQVTCHRSYGQSRKWGIWNAFNRVPIDLQIGDSTASWAYNTNTWRASNNSSANSGTLFCGLAEEVARANFTQLVQQTINQTTTTCQISTGIGFNSTSSPTAFAAQNQVAQPNVGSGCSFLVTPNVPQIVAPLLGINVLTCLEKTIQSGQGVTWFGTSTDMLLDIAWRG